MTTRNDKLVSILTLLSTLTGAALCGPRSTQAATTVYETNFDSLGLGHTLPFPGAPDQDAWYAALATGSAFGEIQIAIANGGRALHEFAPSTNPSGLQTIDRRDLGALDVSAANNITLSTNFYAHTSDLSGSNIYSANFRVTGGPHPGFDIVGFGLFGGHFVPKNVTGVSVALGLFNGVDNNEPLPLTVGQHLTWDAWHTLTFSIDQLADRYVSITVDGATQDLSAYRPPRSGSVRGQLIETLAGELIPSDVGGPTTSDDVYWDNSRLSVTFVPEPSAAVLAAFGLVVIVLNLRGRRAAT